MTRSISRGITEGERKSYTRGYNNGRDRAWSASLKIVEIAKSWRQKARVGYPLSAKCSDCIFFQKEQANHRYGRCSQDSIDGAYQGTVHVALKDWAPNPPPMVLLVDEDFGCINWRPGPQGGPCLT